MLKHIDEFLTYVLKDAVAFNQKFVTNEGKDIDVIFKTALSPMEQYVLVVGNRLIHLNNLLEEIEYGFKVFFCSSIPSDETDSFHHFTFCQRVMDYHISALRDRSLQLVASVFCISKLKDEINWKVFDDPRIPDIVKRDFAKFCSRLKEYNDRKNNYFHRESLPVLMVAKSEEVNKNFLEDFARYKAEWQEVLCAEIKFFKNLQRVYDDHKKQLA